MIQKREKEAERMISLLEQEQINANVDRQLKRKYIAKKDEQLQLKIEFLQNKLDKSVCEFIFLKNSSNSFHINCF